MSYVICGACKHPGPHAQTLPPATGMRRRCADCTKCRAEVKREVK